MGDRRITYHLTPVEAWRTQERGERYESEAFASEGFIHCTDGEALVLEAGNRYYAGDARPYCLLTIDVDRVSSPVAYEDPQRVYPHVYGPIETAAVVAVRAVERDAAGRFIGIGASLPGA